MPPSNSPKTPATDIEHDAVYAPLDKRPSDNSTPTERRRALLLSLLLHGSIFLAILLWINYEPAEPKRFIVVNVGGGTPTELLNDNTNDAVAEIDNPQESDATAPTPSQDSLSSDADMTPSQLAQPIPQPDVVTTELDVTDSQQESTDIVSESTPEIIEAVEIEDSSALANELPTNIEENITENIVEPATAEAANTETNTTEATDTVADASRNTTTAQNAAASVSTDDADASNTQESSSAANAEQPNDTNENTAETTTTNDNITENNEVQALPQLETQAIIETPDSLPTPEENQENTETPAPEVITQRIPSPEIRSEVAATQTIPEPDTAVEITETEVTEEAQTNTSNNVEVVDTTSDDPSSDNTRDTDQAQDTDNPQNTTTDNNPIEVATDDDPEVTDNTADNDASDNTSNSDEATVSESDPIENDPIVENVETTEANTEDPVEQNASSTDNADLTENVRITTPNAQAVVQSASGIPTPDARSYTQPARAIPTASAQAVVSTGRAIPSPATQANVSASRSIPTPQARSELRVGSNTPSIEAVNINPAQGEAGQAGAGPEAPQSGAPARDFEGVLRRPVAIMLDNTNNGYPQTGLQQANLIIEAPVTTDITRLMAVYRHSDAAQVGPVRSTREFFVRLTRNDNAILVHAGGSIEALSSIEENEQRTLNSLNRADIFSRVPRGDTPYEYTLYSNGAAIRDVLRNEDLEQTQRVSISGYTPPDDSSNDTDVNVSIYGYSTGFSYQETNNQYRWIRRGNPASDTNGAVLVDAVIVAKLAGANVVDGGTPLERLNVRSNSGSADLYVNGRKVTGSWTASSGFGFLDSDGTRLDLTPLKTWVIFVPPWGEIE